MTARPAAAMIESNEKTGQEEGPMAGEKKGPPPFRELLELRTG